MTDLAILVPAAAELIAACTARRVKIATAESCTGGLIAATLTEVSGSSAVFDRGFVTYSNQAKTDLLGVPADLIARVGAVSEEVAIAMALGVLAHAPADLAVAVTGIAGPTGGTDAKPVGLVHIAAARRGGTPQHATHYFQNFSRSDFRIATVREALAMLAAMVG